MKLVNVKVFENKIFQKVNNEFYTKIIIDTLHFRFYKVFKTCSTRDKK